MRTLPIPLAGPTYQSRSVAIGNQVTKNFYIELRDGIPYLLPFPGLKSFATAGTGKGRGMAMYNGNAYTVSGTELYKVASNGTTTLIGTIAGTNRVSMVDDGLNLVIANGLNKPYSYDEAVLTIGTDSALPNANTVIHLNSRVIYDQPTGLAFATLDTPLDQDSANVLLSNTRQDDSCIAAHTKDQQVLAFNEESIEPSYAIASTATPPYARINSGVKSNLGLASSHAVASNNNAIYFLGSDRRIYKMVGLQNAPIDQPAIGKEIEDYSTINDAFLICFTFDAQNFVFLSFPTESVSWLYNESSNIWTSLSYGTDNAAHLISGYVKAYGKHLVSDRRNGNIYELDFDTFTDNSDVIQRQRVIAEVNGDVFGAPGKNIFMSRLELTIESGVSAVDSAGTIVMEISDDNGKTWGAEEWHSIGDQGDFTYIIEWFGLGSFKRRLFRFTMTDPIKWVLKSLYADVEIGRD